MTGRPEGLLRSSATRLRPKGETHFRKPGDCSQGEVCEVKAQRKSAKRELRGSMRELTETQTGSGRP